MDYLLAVLNGAVPFLQNLAAAHPAISSVLMVVGMCRAIFKPLMTFLHSIADATPSLKDNELLEKAEGSVVYKWAMWGIDYLFSIKSAPKA